MAKQVISCHPLDKNSYRMHKNEKCTCKVCKTTVFHCLICKFVMSLSPSLSCLLKLPKRKIWTTDDDNDENEDDDDGTLMRDITLMLI